MAYRNRNELPGLEDQLCFSLYAAARAMTKVYRDILDGMGLTYPQYLALSLLWKNNGLTISDLGRSLMLDSGTLTPLVKRLEAVGLVVRKRRPEDEREVGVWLTPKGFAIQERAQTVTVQVARRLFMTDEAVSDLNRELVKLIARLNEPKPSRSDEPLVGYRFASPASATASVWGRRYGGGEHHDEPLVGYRLTGRGHGG